MIRRSWLVMIFFFIFLRSSKNTYNSISKYLVHYILKPLVGSLSTCAYNSSLSTYLKKYCHYVKTIVTYTPTLKKFFFTRHYDFDFLFRQLYYSLSASQEITMGLGNVAANRILIFKRFPTETTWKVFTCSITRAQVRVASIFTGIFTSRCWSTLFILLVSMNWANVLDKMSLKGKKSIKINKNWQ